MEELSWNAQEAINRIANGGFYAPQTVRTDVYKHNLEIFKAW